MLRPASPCLALVHVFSRSSYLAGVLVGQVQRVAGELDTTGLVALDEEGVVVACIAILEISRPFFRSIFSTRLGNAEDIRTISQTRSEETLGRPILTVLRFDVECGVGRIGFASNWLVAVVVKVVILLGKTADSVALQLT